MLRLGLLMLRLRFVLHDVMWLIAVFINYIMV